MNIQGSHKAVFFDVFVVGRGGGGAVSDRRRVLAGLSVMSVFIA